METICVKCQSAQGFSGPEGQEFNIRPKDCGKRLEAPAWIQKTVLFDVLVKENLLVVLPEKEEKPEAPEEGEAQEAQPVKVKTGKQGK